MLTTRPHRLYNCVVHVQTNLSFIFGFISAFNYDYVTCGSSLKLLNYYYNVRLHSHDVKYGSGSGQQVIIGFRFLNYIIYLFYLYFINLYSSGEYYTGKNKYLIFGRYKSMYQELL